VRPLKTAQYGQGLGREIGEVLEDTTRHVLKEMHQIMSRHFGHQHWWPGETPLEIMVGAVLTQNTDWRNVEKAIDNLKQLDLLTFRALDEVPMHRLAEAIRSAGYYNIKADRLKNLIHFIKSAYGGDLDMLADAETHALREGLLSVKGIGPETADSILLYAMERPLFVVDAYTHRILHRHGVIEEEVSYEDLQALFMTHLNDDTRLFNSFHALIVMTGKKYCKKRPACPVCPLIDWGPMSPGR
jgi:endonuclease-3 related protein